MHEVATLTPTETARQVEMIEDGVTSWFYAGMVEDFPRKVSGGRAAILERLKAEPAELLFGITHTYGRHPSHRVTVHASRYWRHQLMKGKD